MKKLLLFIPFLPLGCAAMEPAGIQEETEPIERKEDASYSLTDNDGLHKLSAQHHLLLMKCKTYNDNLTETGSHAADISSSIIASATHGNILKLINLIKDPAQINNLSNQEIIELFELANYLDAPKNVVTEPLAERCHELLTKKQEELAEEKQELPYREKILLRQTENYLFYETFTDFFADYTKKMATIKYNRTSKFNFSHADLKSLGFIKKIKSLKGIREALNAHVYDNQFIATWIDLSGHAIEDFALNDFDPTAFGRRLFRLDLSNNCIQSLKPEQFMGQLRDITLILDGNPITSINIDFTNPNLFVTNTNPNASSICGISKIRKIYSQQILNKESSIE